MPKSAGHNHRSYNKILANSAAVSNSHLVDKDVIKYIGEKGYDPKLGARPIKRIVDEQLKKVLAKEILFGNLEKGGKVFVKMLDNKIVFEYETNKKKELVL